MGRYGVERGCTGRDGGVEPSGGLLCLRGGGRMEQETKTKTKMTEFLTAASLAGTGLYVAYGRE